MKSKTIKTVKKIKSIAVVFFLFALISALFSCSESPAEPASEATIESGTNETNGPNETKGSDDMQMQTNQPDQTDDGYLRLITDVKRTEENLLSNFIDMYHSTVLKEQLPGCEGYPYTMWFFGWAVSDTNPGYPGCDAIFLARGKDLYTWEVWAGEDKWDDPHNPTNWVPIICADVNAWYDNWHNGDPSVVRRDGKYYMMYSSYASGPDMKFSWEAGDVDGDFCCVMGAYSDDGIHWTKSEEPILMWEPEMGNPEFSAHQLSADAENFRGLYHRPSLMFDEGMGKWRIWFDYFDGTYLSVGYAEAEADADIMKRSSWTELYSGDNPMFRNFPNPDVIKIDGAYYMFADPGVSGHGPNPEIAPPTGWPDRQILIAVSDDGYAWRLAGWIAPDSDTPANQIPCGYYENGVLYIYYAAQIGDEGSGEYNWRYDRIRVIEINKEEFEKW